MGPQLYEPGVYQGTTQCTTTQSTTTLSVRSFKPQMQQQTLFEQIKNRINNAKSEPTEKKNPDELMNELIERVLVKKIKFNFRPRKFHHRWTT